MGIQTQTILSFLILLFLIILFIVILKNKIYEIYLELNKFIISTNKRLDLFEKISNDQDDKIFNINVKLNGEEPADQKIKAQKETLKTVFLKLSTIQETFENKDLLHKHEIASIISGARDCINLLAPLLSE